MNFTTPYSFEYDPQKHAKKGSDLPSVTVPDMAYTVRELLTKYTTNSIPAIQQNAMEGDEDYSDAHLTDVDLVDIYLNREKQFKLKQQLKSEAKRAELDKQKVESEKLKAQQEELELLRQQRLEAAH